MFSEFYPRMKTGSDMTKPFSYMTNMDLVETGSDYKIIADIPGVEPSELKVWLDDFDLCIKANRLCPFDESGKGSQQGFEPKVHYHDLSYGEIERHVKLPRNANLESGKTEFKNGVLQVCFPKIMEAKEAEPEHKSLSINVA